MSYWHNAGTDSAALHGADGGELVSVRVRVDSRHLEDVLEALAHADFPINPEICHGYPNTWVEFPAYDKQIADVRNLLRQAGIHDVSLELASMLRAIA